LDAAIARTWQAEDALKKLNDDLENRITERTKELADALQNLKAETNERISVVESLHEKEQM
jgi:C4-dicarboxylate-specific signal transduction histidine kinase